MGREIFVNFFLCRIHGRIFNVTTKKVVIRHSNFRTEKAFYIILWRYPTKFCHAFHLDKHNLGCDTTELDILISSTNIHLNQTIVYFSRASRFIVEIIHLVINGQLSWFCLKLINHIWLTDMTESVHRAVQWRHWWGI